MTLFQRIKKLRYKADILLDELAKRSGVGKATLSRIENGQSLGTTISLVKLARAFNITLKQLLEGVEFK